VEQQGRRRHLGEAKWRELLSRFDAGSDTVEVFCKREGVTKSSFQRWRSLISAGAPVGKAAQRTQQPMQPAGFVDLGMLSLPPTSTARVELTLDLGCGMTLRVARG
jgi:hypothetical protein